MDLNLEGLGRAAGIGGIALGAMTLIFRDVIRQKFLTGLTRKQSFTVITLTIVLTWSVALAGLAAWYFSRPQSGASITGAQNASVIQNAGVITNTGPVTQQPGPQTGNEATPVTPPSTPMAKPSAASVPPPSLSPAVNQNANIIQNIQADCVVVVFRNLLFNRPAAPAAAPCSADGRDRNTVIERANAASNALVSLTAGQQYYLLPAAQRYAAMPSQETWDALQAEGKTIEAALQTAIDSLIALQAAEPYSPNTPQHIQDLHKVLDARGAALFHMEASASPMPLDQFRPWIRSYQQRLARTQSALSAFVTAEHLQRAG